MFTVFAAGQNMVKTMDKYCSSDWVGLGILERLRNENKDKTKTQMTQSFNQYSENETKILRQNILNQFNRLVFLRSQFVIERLRNENEDKTKTHD